MLPGTDFDEIARRYQKDSLVQKAASEVLFDLLCIGPQEDVLDLGCGTGHLTQRIGQITQGRVVGIDPSRQMIAEATAHYSDARVCFMLGAAEALSAREGFDVIFCNSAFQWFSDSRRVLQACRRALRPGGRMGIQAPATARYCPNFLVAVEKAASDPKTRPILARFRSPWLFLETAEEYAALFREAGFQVSFSRIQTAQTRHTPDEVMRIFESGAAAGYLYSFNYRAPLPLDYPEVFRSIVRSSFQEQAGPDGYVDLAFNRIYLVAVKE